MKNALGTVLVAAAFDLLGYALIPLDIAPQDTSYVLTGRHIYLSFTMMLVSWLLFPAPWPGDPGLLRRRVQLLDTAWNAVTMRGCPPPGS
jgi:hypothetical protein